MRVIAGQFKGRPLKAPKGNTTRPTTDRVRESLFSSLGSIRGGLDDAVVLDAFAGSGALGIEALSRGAVFATFCEQNRAALSALNENLSFVDKDCFSIMAGDVTKRVPFAPQQFDLVFFDPPYAYPAETVLQVLERMDAAGMLAAEALVTYEFSAQGVGEQPLDMHTLLGLEYITQKKFSLTAINIYKRG